MSLLKSKLKGLKIIIIDSIKYHKDKTTLEYGFKAEPFQHAEDGQEVKRGDIVVFRDRTGKLQNRIQYFLMQSSWRFWDSYKPYPSERNTHCIMRVVALGGDMVVDDNSDKVFIPKEHVWVESDFAAEAKEYRNTRIQEYKKNLSKIEEACWKNQFLDVDEEEYKKNIEIMNIAGKATKASKERDMESTKASKERDMESHGIIPLQDIDFKVTEIKNYSSTFFSPKEEMKYPCNYQLLPCMKGDHDFNTRRKVKKSEDISPFLNWLIKH